MGWGILAKPGEKYGPCVGACKHKDCQYTRNVAKSICRYCNKEIGYGNKFYQKEEGYAHAICVWDDEENEEKNQTT